MYGRSRATRDEKTSCTSPKTRLQNPTLNFAWDIRSVAN